MNKSVFVAAAVLLAGTAMPAAATPIVYTFGGTFSGVNGGPFNDVEAVFTGIGDTDTLSTNGLTKFVNLTSLSVVSAGLTYNVTTTTQFFLNVNNYAGLFFGSAGNGGGSFAGTGPGLAGYDAVSSLPTSNLTLTGTGPVFFQTDRGDVTISSFTNGTFGATSAAVTAVPETTTWAMMLVGFGMMGASMRYRRRGTKVAYA